MKQEPFSDRLLDEAAEQVFAAMLDDLPAPEECQHTFSLDFEAKMAKICAKEKRRRALRAFSKRAAMVALTCLVGVGSFLTLNTEARAAVTNWFRTQYEDYFSYSFSGEVEPTAPAMLPKAEYAPQYLPVGFKQNSWMESNNQVAIEYVNESSKLLSFGYIPEAQARGWTVQDWALDLADAAHTQTAVNADSADLYTAPSGLTTLLWTSSAYDTAFYLSAELSAAELTDIAESVILSNADELPPLQDGRPPVFDPLYELTAVPEGYVYQERFGDDLTCSTFYVSTQTGDMLSFDAFYIHSGIGMSIGMGKDEYEYETVRVGSLYGEFYRSTVEGVPNFLMWSDEDAGVAFNLHGAFEKEDLLRMAESVVQNR